MRPWIYPKSRSVSELTLDEMFGDDLTSSPCVYLNQDRELNVAIETCVQYLESLVDSIVIRDDEKNVLGIVGGYDLLDYIRRNPFRDFQYETKVKDIMFNELTVVGKTTTFQELMKKWNKTRRAFAIIPNRFQGYSPISSRKMLEFGIKCKTNISLSSFPEKEVITFHSDDSLETIVGSMFKHKTRKLLLEFSNQFISDRLILKEISKILKFQPNIENLLEIPVNQVELDEVTVVKEDLRLDQVCQMMYEMDHPYIIYKDISITPWDICNVLMSEKIIPSYDVATTIVCPHCGKDFENPIN